MALSYLTVSELLDTTNKSITTIFREKGSIWSAGWHNGIDIAAPANTPIKAAADGTAIVVKNGDGLGNYVAIRHTDGKASVYGHMIKWPSVKQGATVKKGQIIGYVGSTGLSTGNHLHFTLIDNYDKNPNLFYSGDLIDPIITMGLGSGIGFSSCAVGTIVEPNGTTKNIGDPATYYTKYTKPSSGSTSANTVTSNKNSSAKLKSIEEVAKEVIAGKWGNGNDRKNRLTKAGYNYNKVQDKVNEIFYSSKKTLKSIDEIANEVIRGDWGNGAERVQRLTAAGYNYTQVQKRVNELL